MKTGEKVIIGITVILGIVALGNFSVMEWISNTSNKPMFKVLTHFNFSPDGLKGFQVYRDSDCYSCHRAVGAGTNMGLSLDGLGSKHDVDYFYNFLRFPEQIYKAKTVAHGLPPKEAAYVSQMPEEKLRLLAVFLSDLKSDQGSSSSFKPPEGKSSFIDAMLDMWVPAGWRSQYTDIRDWMKSNPKNDQNDTKP
jgi:hypothetical protein